MDRSSKYRSAGIAAMIVAVMAFVAIVVTSFIPSGSTLCGDYNLVDGQYVSDPGRGDYEKDGDTYQWVGCNKNNSGPGGIFFGGGWGGSGGSSNRGGGPGFGK